MYLFAYTILEEIPGFLDKGTVAGGDLTDYINGLIELSIIIAAVAAVVVIMVSGVSYMMSEAVPVKADLKERISYALFGLILALASWLILYTINPRLVQNEIDLEEVVVVNNNAERATILKSLREQRNQLPGDVQELVSEQNLFDLADNGISKLEVEAQDSGQLQDYVPPSGTNSQKILDAANHAVSTKMPSCARSGTNGSKLACVSTASTIVERALGKEITNTLSTREWDAQLRKSSDFVFVGNSLDKALPGDIIMSPTEGDNTGHVGISQTSGASSIVSNSSSKGIVRTNTGEYWQNYYGNQKGLDINVYRALD